jgi:hypothetical protein
VLREALNGEAKVVCRAFAARFHLDRCSEKVLVSGLGILPRKEMLQAVAA